MTELELLRDQWCSVARALSVECIAPFSLSLSNSQQWEFAVLLPQFGSERGMLVGLEYSSVAVAEAQKQGYGVSYMQAEHHHLPVCANDYIECFVDWGWVGQGSAPDWYT